MAEESTDGLIIVSSDAPEAPVPAAPPVDTPGAPVSDDSGSDAASPVAPEPSDDADEPAVSPRELRRLVGRMTAQRTAMERELGATRAQVETLMKLIQPAPPDPEPPQTGPPRRPKMSEYATEDDYNRAEEQYHRDMVDYRLAEREAQQQHTQVARTQAEQDAERAAAIRAREAEILKTTPDYYERFERIGPTLAPQVLWALQQAGAHGPDLVLILAANPDEIARLNQIPAHLIGVELGMLRGSQPRSTAPAPNGHAQPSAPRLPEPPQPVGGGSTPVSSGYREDYTQQQFEDWYAKTFPRRRR